MARGTKTNSDSPSHVAVKQATDFQRGHKKDLTVYKHFNGARRMWFMCKRNWHSNAANDEIRHLTDSTYTVPPDDTEAKALYGSEN
eukprot:14012651-Ditylum_brightwellii.AAC.1